MSISLKSRIQALTQDQTSIVTVTKKVLPTPAEIDGRKVDSIRLKQRKVRAAIAEDLAGAIVITRLAHRAMSGQTATDAGLHGATTASCHVARRTLLAGLQSLGFTTQDFPDAIKEAADTWAASLKDDAKFSIGLEGNLAAIGQARCFAEVLGAESQATISREAQAAALEQAKADAEALAKRTAMADRLAKVGAKKAA